MYPNFYNDAVFTLLNIMLFSYKMLIKNVFIVVLFVIEDYIMCFLKYFGFAIHLRITLIQSLAGSGNCCRKCLQGRKVMSLQEICYLGEQVKSGKLISGLYGA